MNNYNPNLQNNDIAESETFLIMDVGTKSQEKITTRYKIWITIAVLIIVGILYFCSIIFIKAYNKSKRRDEFYVQQEVLDYLDERYSEEFVVVYNRGMGPAYNYVQLYAYPKEYKDEKHKFEIQGYYNRWGRLDYYDSYVMVRLTDDYEAYIDSIIREYFDEYKFYIKFDSEWLTSNLPPDTKLEDLWELKANQDYSLPRLFLYLKDSEKEKYNDNNICKMSEHLQKSNFRGLVSIRIYYSDELYKKRNRENVYEDIGANKKDVDGNTIFIYDNKIEY